MKKFITKKNIVITLLVLVMISLGIYGISYQKKTVKNPTEKTSETTPKNTTEIKKNDKSDKKSDEKKTSTKENKKSDAKVEDNKAVENKNTTVEPTHTESNETQTTTTPQNNSVTSNKNDTPASTPCVPTYTTINHPEQGHYETQVIREAWDEPVYERKIVGGATGRIYNNLDEFAMQEEDGNYSVKDVQVDTIHHEAETQQVWVVDQQAWTEQVASGC